MKHIVSLALAATALVGCQLAKGLVPREGVAGTSGVTRPATTTATTTDAASLGQGETGTARVSSDLCTPDPDAEFDVELHRQELADKTTICTMITVEPVAGVPTIEPRPPGWCGRLSKKMVATSKMIQATSAMQALVEGRYWWATTREVLGPLCGNPDDAAVQQQTAYFYQWWVNLTGLAPEQLDGLFRHFASVAGGDESLYPTSMREMCEVFPAPGPEASERERALAAATRASLGCADGDGAPYWVMRGAGEDVSWHLDAAEAPPSELVRAYAVLQCLGDPDAIEDRELAAYAACGMDARALDPAALDREIAGYPELAQAHARLGMAAARRTAARHEAVARKRAAEDPAWKTLLFDAPAAGWKTWTDAYAAERDAVDAARAYELRYTGASRKKARGCWADAHDHLTSHVQRLGAATLDDVRRAMTDTVGAIVLENLVMCADAEGWQQRKAVFAQLLASARPTRGPRYAAYFAVLDALAALRADRERFPMDAQALAYYFRGRSAVASGGVTDVTTLDLARDDAGGVVKKVTRDGDGARIDFKTDRWKTGVWHCTPNNRILQWRPDGTPVYDSDCTYGGQQWVSQTHDPIWIPASMAGGIRAGSFVRAATSIDRHGDAWDAIPVEVWTDKDRTVLAAYLGVDLSRK